MDDARQVLVEDDVEREPARFRHVGEGALDVVAQVGQQQVVGLDGDRSRFDLREVEDVVDE